MSTEKSCQTVSRLLMLETLDSFRPSYLGLLPHTSNSETQALTESRYQAEHQQLAEMRGGRFCNACEQCLCLIDSVVKDAASPLVKTELRAVQG